MAALNNSGRNNYTFTDIQPLNGVNYYRLKQTDIDGRFTFSPVIRNSANGSGLIFSISPNPAKEVINIIYTGRKEAVTIRIYDAQGSLVKQQTQRNQLPVKVEINQLSAGLYFIELADGEIIQQGKFIKQ